MTQAERIDEWRLPRDALTHDSVQKFFGLWIMNRASFSSVYL
jgi:hypothetical protein